MRKLVADRAFDRDRLLDCGARHHPVIVAVNCCFAAMFSSALLGEILTFTVTGAIIVTVVEPDIDGVESDVAVTTTALGLGAVFGAV